MSQIKLPYYPKISAQVRETVFGALEITTPTVYDKPLEGRIIVRVDALECLRDTLGDECFICRDLLYTIVAGEHKVYEPCNVLASYYRKYKSFTNLVNDAYFYGNNEVPILQRVALPLREKVNAYKSSMIELLDNMGGKFLVQTHDYVYFSFRFEVDVSSIKGAIKIC